RLRERNSLGLHGFHGCGYAAVDEGQVIISAIRIRTHTQTERIYDIYYNYDPFLSGCLSMINYCEDPRVGNGLR
ncbi:MAG: hypothetical protein KKD47_10805, partial [Proteobacteria bacterium]|nr:hypothetical protein [Pseudomonadota bacterium]